MCDPACVTLHKSGLRCAIITVYAKLHVTGSGLCEMACVSINVVRDTMRDWLIVLHGGNYGGEAARDGVRDIR